MIVFDTNVVSEMALKTPDARVLAWLATVPAAHRFTTAVTLAEIRAGLAIMQSGRRRDQLAEVTRLILEETFAGRILGFDDVAAEAYALIVSARRRAGRPISFQDAAIAAIASARGASVATRNTRDFVGCGVDVIDPWA